MDIKFNKNFMNRIGSKVAITIAHSDGNKPNILCGGTILDENHIVTAASCVCIDNELVANKRVSVQAGNTSFKSNSFSNLSDRDSIDKSKTFLYM